MKPRIQDSVILITGASAGIGAELAREFARSARVLILVARRKDRLAAMKRELEAEFKGLRVLDCACDITSRADVDGMLTEVQSQVGFVDILINNAGMGDIGLFSTAEWSKINQMLELNMTALTDLTHRLIKPMVARRSGAIMMVSSLSSFQTLPGFAAYSGTKHYVRGFSEALRAELRPYGITVTQVCPGPVATEFASVAVNDPELALPSFLEISANQCAREAVAGFKRGKAVVIPGILPKLAMLLQRVTPEALMRVLLNAMARQIHKSKV